MQTQDMTGKVCLVTGATAGIGEAAALLLAKRGATIVGVGRNPKKNKNSTEMIKTETDSGRLQAPDSRKFWDLICENTTAAHPYLVFLGLRRFDTPSLLERLKSGLSFASFNRLRQNIKLSQEELGALMQISPRTLARRRTQKRLETDESDRLVRVTMNSGEIHVGILAEIGPDSIDVWIPDSGGAIQSFSARDVLKLEEYEGGSPWASLGVASLVVGGVMGGYYILNYDQPSATPDWSPAK